jgi:hypothetical protein
MIFLPTLYCILSHFVMVKLTMLLAGAPSLGRYVAETTPTLILGGCETGTVTS